MSENVSWSYSTVNTLRECNRKYYFSKVLATHGRKSALRRKAYELKNMQNLAMWKGSVIDKFMEKTIIPAIRDKKELNFEQFAEQAIKLAERQFKYSQLKEYENPYATKQEADEEFCILDIHKLKKDFNNEDLINVYNSIRETILNIPKIQMPGGQLLIDFLKECDSLLPNINNWIVYIEKAMVKPQIDLIAYHKWNPVVIDWKLSDSFTSDYSRQLTVCGITIYLKRLEKTDKKPYEYKDIKLFEANLLKGVIKEHPFTETKVNEMIDYINLTSRDILLLTKGSNQEIDIDDFELTDNESSCTLCNYRTLCSFLLLNNNKYDEKLFVEFIQNN